MKHIIKELKIFINSTSLTRYLRKLCFNRNMTYKTYNDGRSKDFSFIFNDQGKKKYLIYYSSPNRRFEFGVHNQEESRWDIVGYLHETDENYYWRNNNQYDEQNFDEIINFIGLNKEREIWT